MVSYFYLTLVYIITIVIYFSASFHVSLCLVINVLHQRISLGLEVAFHKCFVDLRQLVAMNQRRHISKLLNIWLNRFIKTTESLTNESGLKINYSVTLAYICLQTMIHYSMKHH